MYAVGEELVKLALRRRGLTSTGSDNAMDKIPVDELPALLAYLETTQAKLLACVQIKQLNAYPAEGGWSQGQVLAHLMRTELYLYPVFAWLPWLVQAPWLVRALDRLNTTFCKLAGLGFVSLGDQPDKSGGALQQLSPQFRGRFLAPAFLKPGPQQHDWQSLLAKRAHTRARTLKAVRRAPLWRLQAVRFSHPEFGPMTALEFVLFLGKHEEWHIEQLKRIAQQLALPPKNASDAAA